MDYPVIDPVGTGKNIKNLIKNSGNTIAGIGRMLGIADMTGTTHQFMPKPETLAAPTDVSLDSLAAQTPQGNEAALPQADPAAMLADMASIPSHATVKGNPDMLPSAEDVKARLAAMKRAREEHHPET